MSTAKGLIRAGNRRGVDSKKVAPAERIGGRLTEPTMCKRCGAVLSGRIWRNDGAVTHAQIGRAKWKQCPSCAQIEAGEYYGRVVIRGAFAEAQGGEIRKRIANVEERARVTQPQRRVVSIDGVGNVMEVLTTSQKLAHRIVTELKKAFGGRARYEWSGDGSLYAVWERD
jgi:NMD protein affecting ribosome stability and mRNA decay